MIGHSVGEYVAACLAGVFSLDDALELVAERGRRMAEMPAGAMLAVWLSEEEVLPLLGEELSLAAVNAPDVPSWPGRMRRWKGWPHGSRPAASATAGCARRTPSTRR